LGEVEFGGGTTIGTTGITITAQYRRDIRIRVDLRITGIGCTERTPYTAISTIGGFADIATAIGSITCVGHLTGRVVDSPVKGVGATVVAVAFGGPADFANVYGGTEDARE